MTIILIGIVSLMAGLLMLVTSLKSTSDHIPRDGFVRAIDIDSDLSAHKEEAMRWSRRFAG
jgi:hypothetical protein